MLLAWVLSMFSGIVTVCVIIFVGADLNLREAITEGGTSATGLEAR